MRSFPALPLPDSYWVLPGRVLAGEYPGALDTNASHERLGRLLAAGIDCFVDLTEEHELVQYAQLLPRGVEHHRRPIPDHSVPSDPEQMREILALIERALVDERCVYVHCHAGIGRTGTVMGCLLVERGLSGEEALAALNQAWGQSARARVWPTVPETGAQVEFVRAWVHRDALQGDSLARRFRGALVGLAAADALAVGSQGRVPGTFTPLMAPTGGGPYALPPGAWSDDTAMALCLAESLVACGGFDARDQLERYVRWQEQGYWSATGQCVGIAPGVARALALGRWRRQRFSGTHDPRQLDPEPLSRVAPAVMFAFASAEAAVRFSADAARVTSQVPLVIDACKLFAAMLHAALRGASKDGVLGAEGHFIGLELAEVRPRVRALAGAAYRRKSADRVRAGPTIVRVLESALWAFDRTATFADGAVLVANLGERSDVASAVYGQLAGAFYCVEAIPAEWRRHLARLSDIESLAGRLHALAGGIAPP